MEINANEKNELYRALESSGLGAKPVVIGIDGSNGTGKSTLGHCIGCKYGVPVVSVDQFVEEMKDSYANAVNLSAIHVPVARYQNGKRTYVIEGVCLLEVLDRLGVAADILVYIKAYNTRHEWLDVDVCGNELDESEIDELPPLARTIAKYHRKYSPIARATHVVYRLKP